VPYREKWLQLITSIDLFYGGSRVCVRACVGIYIYEVCVRTRMCAWESRVFKCVMNVHNI
jgi:hypothetical protein